jgi:hydroxylysine kinase
MTIVRRLDAETLDGPLLAALPAVSTNQATDCLRTNFGITGDLTQISGERDLNFRVDTSDNRRYVLKIASETEDPKGLDFQNAAMMHVAATDPDLPVPRVISSIDGQQITPLAVAGRTYQVRLLTYLPGEPALFRPSSAALRREAGSVIASFDRAIAGFDHPGAGHALIWDLQHFFSLQPKIPFLRSEEQRALATRTFDAFNAVVTPRLGKLRRQVIHNDLNKNNLLCDPATGRVCGIIDFGDMAHSCLVGEVAIAAAHQLYGETDVLAAIGDVVSGYIGVLPLDPAEIDVLFELVKARLLTRELIVAWRGAANPAATTSYRDDVSRFGWEALAHCDAVDRNDALSALSKVTDLDIDSTSRRTEGPRRHV